MTFCTAYQFLSAFIDYFIAVNVTFKILNKQHIFPTGIITQCVWLDAHLKIVFYRIRHWASIRSIYRNVGCSGGTIGRAPHCRSPESAARIACTRQFPTDKPGVAVEK